MSIIRAATADDVPLIFNFIRGLAEYEKLLPEVEATEERLRTTLFPTDQRAPAECVLAFEEDIPAAEFLRHVARRPRLPDQHRR